MKSNFQAKFIKKINEIELDKIYEEKLIFKFSRCWKDLQIRNRLKLKSDQECFWKLFKTSKKFKDLDCIYKLFKNYFRVIVAHPVYVIVYVFIRSNQNKSQYTSYAQFWNYSKS